MENDQNGFIAYLNSLHNLESSGSNSLAESQALSPYFGEVYASFSLVDKLVYALTNGVPRVAILTGHAGDGKSTVALDVLKTLREMPRKDPLKSPLKEREDIDTPNGRVTIVKDMSELSAERRRDWLREAFEETDSSWLIVSNTGPLLVSLTEYAQRQGCAPSIESEILGCLDQPLGDSLTDGHALAGFAKELLILNLTRWNNLGMVPEILSRLVNHSGWQHCTGCAVESACPLVLNRLALRDAGTVVQERVRWIYRRLVAYERRLTLRQIVAQLALGLTGGMSCDQARQQVAASSADGADRGSAGLERILFSEGFFGYRAGKPWVEAEGLQAVSLMRRAIFGAPVGVEYERRLAFEEGIGWAALPPSLQWVAGRWRKRAEEGEGVRWRFALRRMAYLFGDILPGQEASATRFLDAFLQSPSLRELDKWQTEGKIGLSRAESSRLRFACLRVLLEAFSGFGAGQFRADDHLYLTLRRPDRAVVQPTQMIVESLPFRDFDLLFDKNRNVPVLSYDRGRAELPLSLPLLDYIRRRDAGELIDGLSPIHQAQLDWFRAELLRVTAADRQDNEEVAVLRAGIDGTVQVYRFLLDQGNLERSL